MSGHRAHHFSLPKGAYLLLALATALSVSCRKQEEGAGDKKDDGRGSEAAGDEGPREGAAELVNRSVPGTPLEMQLPGDWRFDDVDPGELPPAPIVADGKRDGGPAGAAASVSDKKGPIALLSRTMLSARAPTSKLGERVTAWLLVQHDPWLPAGTTTTDYLQAQRESNQGAVPQLKHVEAERSRRQGRPAYYVRDEWSAPYVDREVTFSQETLLLIDVEDERLHGYSLTVTLPKEDREELAPVLRQMLESVRFKKR